MTSCNTLPGSWKACPMLGIAQKACPHRENSLHPSRQPFEAPLVATPFYRWENRGSEREKSTQECRVGIWTQVGLTLKLIFFLHPISTPPSLGHNRLQAQEWWGKSGRYWVLTPGLWQVWYIVLIKIEIWELRWVARGFLSGWVLWFLAGLLMHCCLCPKDKYLVKS
jgi:hypothetical protein